MYKINDTQITKYFFSSLPSIRVMTCVLEDNLKTLHCIQKFLLLLQMRLMQTIRDNIERGTFPQFVNKFVNELYSNGDFPPWIINSLSSVGISIVKK